MKIVYFFIENFNKISPNDLNFIRQFYLPIIGSFSTVLYEYLSDLEAKNTAYKPGINIDELKSQLSVTDDELILAKKNLEAVGLIRTFTKNDNKNGLITILKPLSLSKFIVNDILKSNLIKRIGVLRFEQLVLEHKPRPISKNDYIETSAKYFDVFDYSFDEPNLEYETADLKLPTFDNHIDAMKTLTPDQYIKFLDNGSITFGQKEYINYARNIGLSDPSINTILNYSFECNGRIVVNFIKKITNDLYQRNLISFKEISDALKDSIQSRKRKNGTEELDWGHVDNNTPSNDNKSEQTKEITLNELLEDLRDLM